MFSGQNVKALRVKVKSVGPKDHIFSDDDIANSNFVKLRGSTVINS